MKLFSINKAADLLERDRATLVRALRHTRPDGAEGGMPRYRMRTITDALAAHEARNISVGRVGPDRLRSRLSEIADALERTYKVLDENRRLIAAEPTQDRVRAAMAVFDRLCDLHDEADAIMRKLDPGTVLPYVSGPIIGTEFREILAVIWGTGMTIDGMQLFPSGYGCGSPGAGEAER